LAVRSLVVVPTFQEADNISRLLASLRREAPDSEVLILDDDSPDGTAGLAESMAVDLGAITVIRRPAKDGLGSAYRQGFTWALEQGFDVVVQMDADLSHDPAMVPTLVSLAAGDDPRVDCVVGSRYVAGGSTPDWPLHRRMLSLWGNRYTAAALKVGISDVTSGFRAYRAEALRAIDPASTRSNGYAFMSELARRMALQNMTVVEVPITFVDRAYGSSKMSVKIMVESLALVSAWGVRQRMPRRVKR